MLTEHSIFSYSYDLNQLTSFAKNIRQNGHLQPIASNNSAYVALFSEVKWESSVWKGNLDSSSVRKDPTLIFTYQGLKDGESYYLGWIKIDATISEGGYQDGSYVELYSDNLDFCQWLVSSGFYDLECTYSYLDVLEKYIAIQVLPPSKRQDNGPLRQHVQLTMHTSAGKTPLTLS